MTDLSALLQHAGELANNLLIKECRKELTGFFHLVAPGGTDAVLVCPWHDEREKVAVLAEVKNIAHRMRAQAAMFCGEVWMVTRDAPTPWHAKRIFDGDPPSEQPDRQECVFAVATDGDTTMARMWQIVRSRPGGPVLALVEQKEMVGDFQGRLVDGLIPAKEGKPR